MMMIIIMPGIIRKLIIIEHRDRDRAMDLPWPAGLSLRGCTWPRTWKYTRPAPRTKYVGRGVS